MKTAPSVIWLLDNKMEEVVSRGVQANTERHEAKRRPQTLESPISAIPTESFLFMPPDSARTCVCRLSVSPIHSIILSISSFTRQDGQFFNLAKSQRCSSTVRRSNSTSCCGQRPEREVSYATEAQQ